MTKKFFQPFENQNPHFEAKIKKLKDGDNKSALSQIDVNKNLFKRPHKPREKNENMLKKRGFEGNDRSSMSYGLNNGLEGPPGAEDFIGFHYYNVFKGQFKIDLPESKQNCDMSLFSCAGQEFIRYFTQVPDNLHLVPKVDKEEFQNYLDKALIQQQKKY